MGGLRLKQWAGFVGVWVCLVAAGCGSTQTVTQTITVTKTKTVTRTVVHHAKAAPTKTVTVAGTSAPLGPSTYPTAFRSRFNAACTKAGVYDPSFCRCALTYIEAHVPFSTVAAQVHLITNVTQPAWFTAASNHCAGK